MPRLSAPTALLLACALLPASAGAIDVAVDATSDRGKQIARLVKALERQQERYDAAVLETQKRRKGGRASVVNEQRLAIAGQELGKAEDAIETAARQTQGGDDAGASLEATKAGQYLLLAGRSVDAARLSLGLDVSPSRTNSAGAPASAGGQGSSGARAGALPKTGDIRELEVVGAPAAGSPGAGAAAGAASAGAAGASGASSAGTRAPDAPSGMSGLVPIGGVFAVGRASRRAEAAVSPSAGPLSEAASEEGRPLDAPAPRRPGSERLLAAAETALRAGRYGSAEALARAAIAADPSDPRAQELLAWALLKQGRYAEARDAASRAIALGPRRALAYALRAYANEGLGDRDGLIGDLARAAALDPRYAPQLEAARRGRRVFDPSAGDELFLGDLLFTMKPRRPWRGLAGVLALGAAAAGAAAALRFRRRERAAPAKPSSGETPSKVRLERLLRLDEAGELWEARDDALQRPVAVRKVPAAGEERRRIVERARRAAGLHHPALAQLYEILEGPDSAWLVYEPITGPTLAEHLERLGPCGPRKAAEWLEPVRSALEAAAAAGVPHGAVALERLELADGGFVRLRDLGLFPPPLSTEADRAALESCRRRLAGARSA